MVLHAEITRAPWLSRDLLGKTSTPLPELGLELVELTSENVYAYRRMALGGVPEQVNCDRISLHDGIVSGRHFHDKSKAELLTFGDWKPEFRVQSGIASPSVDSPFSAGRGALHFPIKRSALQRAKFPTGDKPQPACLVHPRQRYGVAMPFGSNCCDCRKISLCDTRLRENRFRQINQDLPLSPVRR
jgi:hypothetical protein